MSQLYFILLRRKLPKPIGSGLFAPVWLPYNIKDTQVAHLLDCQIDLVHVPSAKLLDIAARHCIPHLNPLTEHLYDIVV
jgi:hypothetical protein